MYPGGAVFEQWCSFCRQVVYLVHLNAPRLDVLPPHTERIVNEETGVTATIRRAHPPKRRYTKRKGSWKSHRVSARDDRNRVRPGQTETPSPAAKEPALKAAGEICPRCGLSFQNSQGLKHHITSKHGGSPPGRVASGPVDLERRPGSQPMARVLRPAEAADVKERMRAYRQRPDVKERKRAYQQRPDVKERMRAYDQRPDVKERMRAYDQRPDVKERMRAYDQRRLKKPEARLPTAPQREGAEARLPTAPRREGAERAYDQRPDVKERKRAYQQRPEEFND